ncbi:serpin family protein [Patescibacteria group bacterium]|nr:serpin family protein [Patescibacteria group bacterium]MBU1728300.1 serpin family protein [Patescibacteria group bacterium]
MKNKKGFGIGILIMIIAVLAVGGVAYYKNKSPKIEPINLEEENLPQEEQNGDENIPIENGQTGETEDDSTEVTYIKVENDNPVVMANNKFAFDVYPKLIENGKNTFFSPLSISSAFGMVYEGANGKTADEIRSVFHFPKDINILRNSFSSINNEINKTSSEYQLSIANALWAQKDYKFLDEYFSSVGKYYGGKVTNVDFKNATEEARLAINKWVEDRTNDKIKEIISKGVLSVDTRLVLTNAIYFNGKWSKTFEKKGTKENSFFIDSENNVEVNMMKQANNDETLFNYSENDDLQILEMPYKGDKLSMIVVLPKKNDITSFEKLLTFSNFNSWKKSLKKQRVNVFIPQFKFDAKYSMVEDLKSMGMPISFSPGNADFSKMDGTKDLFISDVIHQSFVDVNEDGTEAAAATAVVMGVTSAGPFEGPVIPTFNANHPFVFMIQDTTNGNILFMGRVVNPNLKN